MGETIKRKGTMKTEQQIRAVLAMVTANVTHNKHERQVKRSVRCALQWVLGDIQIEAWNPANTQTTNEREQ